MTDTASEARTEADGAEDLAGPIPVDDWLEQAVTITADVNLDRGPGSDVASNDRPPMPPDSHAMETTTESEIEQEPVDEDVAAHDEKPGDALAVVDHDPEFDDEQAPVDEVDEEEPGLEEAPADGELGDAEPEEAPVEAEVDEEQPGLEEAPVEVEAPVGESPVVDEPAVDDEPAGYHEEVDDTDEGNVLIGTVPVAATASDDYSASLPGDDRPPGRYRRRSVVSALAFALALIALGGAAAYVLALYLPDRWTAEAEVVLDPGNASVDRYLATQQVLMESSVILDRALEELPVDRDYVERELRTFPIEASTAIGINFIDPDPDLARDVVAAVLGSFMTEVDVTTADFSTPIYQRRVEDLQAQRQELERRLRDFEAANAEAEANEEPLPYPAEVRRMALESEQLLAQINSLESTMVATEVATIERNDAIVVTEPRVLTKPTWPNPLVFTALGLLVGLVVAVVALFLLASRRVS